jgi:hypothetical protein
MIIMDQCSRVFFDRTRPLDQRPEVMDLFGAAIGTVVSTHVIRINVITHSLTFRRQKKPGSLMITSGEPSHRINTTTGNW